MVRFALVSLLAVIIAVLVLPGPRRTVANWFGIGSTHIVRTPQAPATTSRGAGSGQPQPSEVTGVSAAAPPAAASTPTSATSATSPAASTSSTAGAATAAAPATFPATLDLGTALRPAEATARTGLPTPIAPSLGQPTGTYVTKPPGSGQIVVTYAPSAVLPVTPVAGVGALLAAMPGALDDGMFMKVQGEGTTIESLTFTTATGHSVHAVWLSGTPHTYVFVDGNGSPLFDTLRLATNTLLWEDAGVTYRLEAGVTRQAAIAIAQDVVTT